MADMLRKFDPRTWIDRLFDRAFSQLSLHVWLLDDC